jgi:hypothetical protein
MVSLSRVGSLLVRQLAEWRSSLIILDDITRSDNISEAIALSDLSTLLSFSAND